MKTSHRLFQFVCLCAYECKENILFQFKYFVMLGNSLDTNINITMVICIVKRHMQIYHLHFCCINLTLRFNDHNAGVKRYITFSLLCIMHIIQAVLISPYLRHISLSFRATLLHFSLSFIPVITQLLPLSHVLPHSSLQHAV